jgi:hypothetical protein
LPNRSAWVASSGKTAMGISGCALLCRVIARSTLAAAAPRTTV